jgi:hypothetical protein
LFRPLPLRERFPRAPLHLALPRAVEKADQPINHFLRFDLFHEVALYLRLRRSDQRISERELRLRVPRFGRSLALAQSVPSMPA